MVSLPCRLRPAYDPPTRHHVAQEAARRGLFLLWDLSLAWTDICLEDRAFATAAKHVFRSWRKALILAGFDPELHRKKRENAP